MDMSVVGSVMTQQAKVSTLEKVNTHLLKSNNEQLEQQTAQGEGKRLEALEKYHV